MATGCELCLASLNQALLCGAVVMCWIFCVFFRLGVRVAMSRCDMIFSLLVHAFEH